LHQLIRAVYIYVAYNGVARNYQWSYGGSSILICSQLFC